jgi:hypothetical protein
VTLNKVHISKKRFLNILREVYSIELDIQKYQDPNLRFNKSLRVVE